MENENDLTQEEKLKMENELLKCKLTAEFGMKKMSSPLDEESENQWLNYLYNFEKSYENCGQIKVYDFIGKPGYKSADILSKKEITAELERLCGEMHQNNIVLDLLCEYEDEVIYRFITEELFQVEMDDMRIEGMKHCFIYEEFHPNHEYDLKESTDNFFNTLFNGDWNAEYDSMMLYDKVEFNNNSIDRNDFTDLIMNFQECCMPVEKYPYEIEIAEFNLDNGAAKVNGKITYCNSEHSLNRYTHSGDFTIRFTLDDLGYWDISYVRMPGFGDL